MKILHLIYELVPGGAERFVIDLTNELSKDCEVSLYTLRDDTKGNSGFYVPEINERIKYVNLKIKPGFNPLLLLTFYKILRSEKPDIVHCHLNLVNYFFLLSVLFKNRIRFFYTIHNSAETEVETELEKAVMRFFFKHRYFVPVAISDETKASYQLFYRLNDLPVIYNGRKFNGKTPGYESVVNEISELKPTSRTKVFCHVSRYDEKQKNHKMLVSVFNRLSAENFDVVLLIIGEGFERASELKKLANKNIHFIGIRSNVTDYLYASDAFCLSSNFEGMPISLIEAFACGCPSICTPVGGIVNSVKHGETGFLSKSLSEDDYLEAVKQFIISYESIDKERLIRFYHENFSIEQCKTSYMNLYKSNE
jgi:glycosyltransferase involved in cell wall biosynthesis